MNRTLGGYAVSVTLAMTAAMVAPWLRADDEPKPEPFVLPARPTTAPATKPAAVPAKVSPEARALLDEVKAAYTGLTSLELAGTITFDADVAGKTEKEKDDLTGSFQAPNKFRHEMKGNMVAGSTGEKAYAMSIEENTYIQKDAPKERFDGSTDAPPAVWNVLTMQNPSLAMAMARDPAQQLIDGATGMTLAFLQEGTPDDLLKDTSVTRTDDVKVGDAALPALRLTNPVSQYTFAFDPKTHLLRQVTVDQRKLLEKVGQPDVKGATFTFDYTTVTPGAKVPDDRFAWAPPSNARELTATAARRGSETGEVASPLLGKPAPDFKLPGLDGKEVALADMKGSVVILDFWATWCGPCVESLPNLNKLYEEKKAAGLKVFAINHDENKGKVPPFLDAHKLTLKVLFDDPDHTVGEKYGVEGIPHTVVIGKDGLVKKVYSGVGGGTEAALTKAVEAEMK